jgi:hypothetical protein
MTHEQERDMVRASLVAAECRRDGREAPSRRRCVCGCGRRGVHRHHVVYEQHLTARQARDDRNKVWMALDCHFSHHNGARRLPLAVLPASVFEFAAEVMPVGEAYEYLFRRYSGTDERLDALLRRWEAENPMHDDGN